MTAVTCELRIPDLQHLFGYIEANATLARERGCDVVTHESHAGKTLAICGAGPSLADHFHEIDADCVWACNSALPYLIDRGVRVTHGFTVDQGREMLSAREFGRGFDVEYLLGSSVHPALTELLLASGKRITWFHNYLGLHDPEGWTPPLGYDGQTKEFYLYASQFPAAPQVGYGLNSVPRAMCLALWMGFTTIRVYGADCAAKPNGPWMPAWGSPAWEPWLRHCQLYADGRTAFDAYGADVSMVQNETETILGDPSTLTRWHTRPDMVISAMHMANLARASVGRLFLVGDTLPNAMMDKPREWFDTCPQLTLDSGVIGFEGVTPEPA